MKHQAPVTSSAPKVAAPATPKPARLRTAVRSGGTIRPVKVPRF